MDKIYKAEDVIKYAKDIITDWDKEHTVGVYLNADNRIKKIELISMGSITETVTEPREVIKPALLNGAVAYILLHNHPSGDVKPSKADLKLTKRLKKASDLMGIIMLDHIVFCKGKPYYSMEANGDFKKMKGGGKK